MAVPNSPAGISLRFARGFIPAQFPGRERPRPCPPAGPMWGIHCLSLFLEAHLVKRVLGQSVDTHILLFLPRARKQKLRLKKYPLIQE